MREWRKWFSEHLTDWLVKEADSVVTPLCDFDRLSYELRPGDVVLVEGRSRISEVIKVITNSNWTHSALYLGRIYDINAPELREKIRRHYKGDPNDQLLLESELGTGTCIAPLSKYRYHHVRICRPQSLVPDDARRVTKFALQHLGDAYDVRQIFDMGRFLFPWAILPRRWRSSLFQKRAGVHTRTVCSCLIAEAFNHIDYPILPFIDRQTDGSLRFYKRNPKLFTPRDFDYSPYFEIIKYPFLGIDDVGLYRRMPWNENGQFHNDEAPPDIDEELLQNTAKPAIRKPVANADAPETHELVSQLLEKLGVKNHKGVT